MESTRTRRSPKWGTHYGESDIGQRGDWALRMSEEDVWLA